MRTEEQIVYELLNIVNGGMITNDSPYGERLIRSFLRKHRASKLNTFYKNGQNLDDYIFQTLGNQEAKRVSDKVFSFKIPAIIHFSQNMGIKLFKGNLDIPLVDEESFELSLSNPINKSFPKAKIDGQTISVYIGYSDPCNFISESKKEKTVSEFEEESKEVDDEPRIYVGLKAVLYDPGEASNYNWTRDPYPCPSEIIDQITTSTLHRDLDLMIRQKPDLSDNNSVIDPPLNPNDV